MPGSGFDPNTFQLAMVLTAAGAVVASALIAALILILKRVPGLGAAIDNDKENFTAVVLTAVLVIFAAAGSNQTPNAGSFFADFLAFVNIATLSAGGQGALAQTSAGKALSGKSS